MPRFSFEVFVDDLGPKGQSRPRSFLVNQTAGSEEEARRKIVGTAMNNGLHVVRIERKHEAKQG